MRQFFSMLQYTFTYRFYDYVFPHYVRCSYRSTRQVSCTLQLRGKPTDTPSESRPVQHVAIQVSVRKVRFRKNLGVHRRAVLRHLRSAHTLRRNTDNRFYHKASITVKDNGRRYDVPTMFASTVISLDFEAGFGFKMPDYSLTQHRMRKNIAAFQEYRREQEKQAAVASVEEAVRSADSSEHIVRNAVIRNVEKDGKPLTVASVPMMNAGKREWGDFFVSGDSRLENEHQSAKGSIVADVALGEGNVRVRFGDAGSHTYKTLSPEALVSAVENANGKGKSAGDKRRLLPDVSAAKDAGQEHGGLGS